MSTSIKLRMQSPDGGYVEGELAWWVVAIYNQLTVQQKKAVCDHMYNLKIERDG